ncbi:G patch domain-containing protein TGH homolog isoform X2 [Zingiber officinale]|uniref:G patch domain-containing protein TGH homolog isoform X1 n=1 Tax=Zingiber officinale TaxID=94328 RepID=UPI001C4B3DD7|nr:G patch domain-containing protein TGH homolog isoform X1 [Zingiber officinale]XP_042472782.1 G patch domain-containing protein TGH homolog isoform X2 [Zingiber officinale]
MAIDEDEEDFIFYGTPIEREEDTSARKRKAIADAGQLRSLPLWKQEVRDEEGRRRFHGAFTGGYSAGYYNTVGSKEGWTPQTFTSSRKNRAEVKQQNIYSFLDEDDIKAMGGQALETSMQFDTFGFTAAEYARKHAEKEQHKRPSAIPGPAPDEIVIPASTSIGVKLLLKMGWRHGHSIKDAHVDSLYESRREARKAFLAFSGNEGGAEPSQKGSHVSASEEYDERGVDVNNASKSVPEYVVQPKQDLYGLGYDPYKTAPEFRDKKRLRESKSKNSGIKGSMKTGLLSSNSGKYAPGFGIGALEELDIEDEDIYASGFDFEQTEVEEDEQMGVIRDTKYRLEGRKSGSLPGFKVASSSDYTIERFHPPVIPANFDSHHKFSAPLETVFKVSELPPPEVPPPEDSSLRLLIDGFATLVTRCGKLFEDLSREKNRSNPMFSFLTGGDGHNYYIRKLWEEKQKNINQVYLAEDLKSKGSVERMTAENRGRILGEKQLERRSKEPSTSAAAKEIHFQSNLSDAFTKPSSLVGVIENAKTFKDDPAKQERFEQFLKDKYKGGLRSTQPLGIMSEDDRARERLDFEAAAEAIEKGEQNPVTASPSMGQLMDFSGSIEQQFISSTGPTKTQDPSAESKMTSKVYPKREEFQWRPMPVLCKRFDIIDPFMGKPPPLPRPKSKMDTLFFMTESIREMKPDETISAKKESVHLPQFESKESEKLIDTNKPEIQQDIATLQKPVDLYKAIFSDDSDDDADADAGTFTKAADPMKKSEGANMTLNRLFASDFLESLGAELGLEVPPDVPSKLPKGDSSSVVGETANTGELKVAGRNGQSLQTPEAHKVPQSSEVLASGHNDSGSNKNCTPGTGFSLDANFDSYHGKGNVNRYASVSAGGRFSDLREENFDQEKTQFLIPSSKIHSRYDGNSPDSSSDHQEPMEKGTSNSRNRQGRSRSPDSDSSGGRYQTKRNKSHSRRHRRNRTPDSTDEYQSKRKKSNSRHRRRSATPDNSSSSDYRDGFQSKSRSKRSYHHDSSKKHSEHSKRKKKHSVHSRTDHRKNYD